MERAGKPNPRGKLMDLVIPFYHHYDKFKGQEFTTIRGKTFGQGKAKIGRQVVCRIFEKPVYEFGAFITKIERMPIQEIPFGLLQADGQYSGFSIESHFAFTQLINSLRKSWMPQANLESICTIFFLTKTAPDL